MPISKPNTGEYAPYYHTYIDKVNQLELIDALTTTYNDVIAFLESFPPDKHIYRYAEGKWTPKELLGHIIDAERVFAYRAMRISRNDTTDLPGFDENKYVPESNANMRSWESLIEEYSFQRKATILLFEGMTEAMTERAGTANGHKISVRALGFIISGHELHHMQVLKERYL